MRQDVQNKSVHAVATSIVFSRVPVGDLPDAGPRFDLRKCNVPQLVSISDAELQSVKDRYRIIVTKILLENFRCFSAFKQCGFQSTYCKHAEETSRKSHVVTLPIIMKDEKKYAECVDILDQLEEWVLEIYSAAGHTHSVYPDELLPQIGSSSRPGQPAAHIPPSTSEDDPLHGIKIPCFGDQLTRVRLAGAKDLRAGCHSPKQRLDHLYPFCIADWHTKRSYLKV